MARSMRSSNLRSQFSKTFSFALVLIVSSLLSCSDDKEAGVEGGACYGNGSCNPGLTCASDLCVRLAGDSGAEDDIASTDASDGSVPDTTRDASTDDATASDATSDATSDTTDDSGPDAFVSTPYPSGPYGTANGDIVENASFQGYAARRHICVAHDIQRMDTTLLYPIAFEDFFVGSSACAEKRKLLWVAVTAAWCGPCNQMAEVVQGIIDNGNLSNEVSYLTLLVEGPSAQPATASDLGDWIANFSISSPVAMGTSPFPRWGLPTNFFIRTDTMEIVDFAEGGMSEAEISNKIDTLLASLP